jgi:hypothetical protein
VDCPVGGQSLAGRHAPSAVEIGHGSPRLFDHNRRRGEVPWSEVLLHHRLRGAIGHQGVAPEVAEAPLAPHLADEAIVSGRYPRVVHVIHRPEEDLRIPYLVDG